MNTVRVRLFARARDLAGVDTMTVTLPAGATVAELRRRLAEQQPRLTELLGRSALAINEEFAEESATVPAGAEVALLPPVSGGRE
jgi:molybdopterin converting factor subunit 1